MKPEERKEIKEIISDIMTGINARIESKFDIIDFKLDAIKNINDKVQNHEIKIRKLEDTNLSQKSVKKFIGAMFASGLVLGGLIVAFVEFLMKI